MKRGWWLVVVALAACQCGPDECRADEECPDGSTCVLDDGVLVCAGLPPDDGGVPDAGVDAGPDRSFILNGRDYIDEVADLVHVHAAGTDLTVNFTGAGCDVSGPGGAVDDGDTLQPNDDDELVFSCDGAEVKTVTVDLLSIEEFVAPASAVINEGEASAQVPMTWTLSTAAECRVDVQSPSDVLTVGTLTANTSEDLTVDEASAGVDDGYTLGLACVDDAVPPVEPQVSFETVQVAKVNSAPAPVKVDLDDGDADLDVHFGESFDFAWDIDGVTACNISDGQENVDVADVAGAQTGSLPYNEASFSTDGTGTVSVTCVNGGVSYTFVPAFDFAVTVRVDARDFTVRWDGAQPQYSWSVVGPGGATCVMSATNGFTSAALATVVDQAIGAGTDREVVTLTCSGAPYLDDTNQITVFYGNVDDPNQISDLRVKVAGADEGPAASGIAGELNFSTPDELTGDLALPALQFVGENINISAQDDAGFTQLLLRGLTFIDGDLTISGNDNLTGVVAPLLDRVTGGLAIQDNTATFTTFTLFPDATCDGAQANPGTDTLPCARITGNYTILNTNLDDGLKNTSCARSVRQGNTNVDGTTPACD
jgi:hypothetical protein